MRVLLIDDHALFRRGLRLMLRELMPEADVSEADSCASAIEQASSAFELILLDLNLPDLDGLQVKARLSQDPATRDTPVIAVTANATSDDLKAGLRAGFLDYVTKPIDIAALVAALALALGPDGIGRRRAA